MHVVVEVSLFEVASPSAPLSLQTPSRTGTVVVVLDFLQLDNLLSLQNLACSEVQLPSLKVVLLGSLAPLQVLSRMTLSPFAPVATRSALILSVLGNVLLGTPPSLHSLLYTGLELSMLDHLLPEVPSSLKLISCPGNSLTLSNTSHLSTSTLALRVVELGLSIFVRLFAWLKSDAPMAKISYFDLLLSFRQLLHVTAPPPAPRASQWEVTFLVLDASSAGSTSFPRIAMCLKLPMSPLKSSRIGAPSSAPNCFYLGFLLSLQKAACSDSASLLFAVMQTSASLLILNYLHLGPTSSLKVFPHVGQSALPLAFGSSEPSAPTLNLF